MLDNKNRKYENTIVVIPKTDLRVNTCVECLTSVAQQIQIGGTE
jgi:hypothetical protein